MEDQTDRRGRRFEAAKEQFNDMSLLAFGVFFLTDAAMLVKVSGRDRHVRAREVARRSTEQPLHLAELDSDEA
ncbi:hypothetical protein [Methylobacterium crusticola]|uniref:hypothetical protein n=1 Tax=Methylobacterium crusticola TaxID=1697972 RepID=UPI001EE1A8F2|nr:hypothetical protein [Methylobacterium crusticola]